VCISKYISTHILYIISEYPRELALVSAVGHAEQVRGEGATHLQAGAGPALARHQGENREAPSQLNQG
jgi:hypothetical protein